MDSESKFNFKAVLVTAITTALFGFVGTLMTSSFANKSASLQYEILPISNSEKGSVQISIVTIKVWNGGTKECEDVEVNIGFGKTINANDYSVQKSSLAIPVHQNLDTTTGRIIYSIPYLNPQEQIVFSFSFNKIITGNNIQVDLRGRGLNGEKSELSTDASYGLNVLIFGTFGLFIITIILISIILFHQEKVIKFLRLQLTRLKKELEEKSK